MSRKDPNQESQLSSVKWLQKMQRRCLLVGLTEKGKTKCRQKQEEDRKGIVRVGGGVG